MYENAGWSPRYIPLIYTACTSRLFLADKSPLEHTLQLLVWLECP